MASAFHWEARRRQMQMERRLHLRQEREGPGGTGQQQQGQQQEEEPREESKAQDLPPASSSWPQGSKPAMKDASCHCNTAHPPQQSGKLLRRYSNRQYVQQW